MSHKNSILKYFRDWKSHERYFHFRGMKIIHRGGFDKRLLEQICTENEYEIVCPGLFDQPYGTLVDIGANIGAVSVGFSDRFTKIYGMEPSKNNFLLLQKSVILNGLEDKVTLYNVGIGKRREEARLYAFMSDHQKKVDKEWNFGAKMMYYNPAIHDPDVFETISLMPYDWFEQTLPKKIDLLKIDCEGAEEFIFYNTDRSDLSPLVKDRVTRFVGELHPGLNPSLDTEKLIDFLRKHFEIRVSENPTENTFFLIYGKKKS